MARVKKSDPYDDHIYTSREATIRAQEQLLDIITGYYFEKIKRTVGYDPVYGLGLRGVAVEWARIGYGLKWSEQRVELAYKFLSGMQDLGIIQIVDDPRLPNANDNLFRQILFSDDTIANADTRIKTQRNN
jgi:hypothetical protein